MAKHPVRHYRGRDIIRAAVHCIEHPGQLLELHHRIWLATILALFVSFWLQLEAPTGALTVAILAEPTRGQALVRLAQRVPVRIAIDQRPPGVPLVSGLTATVTIRNGKDGEKGNLFQRVRADLETNFSGLLGGASAWPGCIPDPSSPSPRKASY